MFYDTMFIVISSTITKWWKKAVLFLATDGRLIFMGDGENCG